MIKIKKKTCPPHPITRQRWTEFADDEGGPTYEALVCLDCNRQLRPEQEEKPSQAAGMEIGGFGRSTLPGVAY